MSLQIFPGIRKRIVKEVNVGSNYKAINEDM